MAHLEQHNFLTAVRAFLPDFFTNKKVLEIGSLDINGSCRELFYNCAYLGVDLGIGPSVNLVFDGAELNLPDNTFDVVLSTECFEHNRNWIKTFLNMHRMCNMGGLIIMTCASDPRPEHGTTTEQPLASPFTIEAFNDYYKNLNETDFHDNFNISDMFIRHQFIYNYNPGDLYFWGIKK